MNYKIERRSFMRGAGAIVGATATVALNETSAHAEVTTPTGAKSMTYDPKPLSLDPKAIKGISEKVLVSHYENNYLGAVKRLGAIALSLPSSTSPRRQTSSSTA